MYVRVERATNTNTHTFILKEMEQIIGGVKDSNLKLTLAFGIGMHHAGLIDRDRRTVEELFVNQKIQVRKYFYFCINVKIYR